MTTLTPELRNTFLSTHPDWHLDAGKLVQTLRFAGFQQAMWFVNQVAALAEMAGHHPDIDIRYNHVHLALVTHDAGGLTEKDTALAGAISAAFLQEQAAPAAT